MLAKKAPYDWKNRMLMLIPYTIQQWPGYMLNRAASTESTESPNHIRKENSSNVMHLLVGLNRSHAN